MKGWNKKNYYWQVQICLKVAQQHNNHTANFKCISTEGVLCLWIGCLHFFNLSIFDKTKYLLLCALFLYQAITWSLSILTNDDNQISVNFLLSFKDCAAIYLCLILKITRINLFIDKKHPYNIPFFFNLLSNTVIVSDWLWRNKKK